MSAKYSTAQEAMQNASYVSALKELLYQLADDDLLISHRASEWLGLVPHIEEDVAFSSIAQNTLGHAAMFYQLLEELGEGTPDDLAHLREPDKFRNAILAERANGTGHYTEDPDYDWGYAVIRNYVYEAFKRLRLESLTASSYSPLADVAAKILREQFYHLYHWETWIEQLSHSTSEAEERLNNAIRKTWEDVASLFDLGPAADQIRSGGLMGDMEEIRRQFTETVRAKFEAAGLIWPGEMTSGDFSGREGKHTEELRMALEEIGSVYRLDPAANW
jgi:ring-1,2-phenylacetyl-CoA epoxidase subunit PaaC